MLLKRHIPLFIVISVGLLILFGHFINNDSIQNFVDNDATQWFDIIASFAIFLGGLNMLKLQLLKIIKKKENWHYSILAVLGFIFAIFAGFFYRGANYILITELEKENTFPVAEILATELNLNNPQNIADNISSSENGYEIPNIFMTESSAKIFMEKLKVSDESLELHSKPWGAHLQTQGSLFSWMFFKIFSPLAASMFALLAFFVASASYRAFRIRNFEATLLLVSGIILMLGRVPIGDLIPWWLVMVVLIFGLGAISAPLIQDRKLLLGLVGGGIILCLLGGTWMGWNQTPPSFLSIPIIQDWIFSYPTTAGSRALLIGVALGTMGTSFRIILGIERSFLGE